MANYGNYEIPVFEDDMNTIKEFLRICLHTIFFHRWIGDSQIEDVESQFSNINYVRLKNKELDKSIEQNINIIEKNLLKFNKTQLILNFYQKRVQKFYIMNELANMWESWKFFLILKKESQDNQINNINNTKVKEAKIREYIFFVLEKLNDKLDFMPDFNLNQKDDLPMETFPYEFKINNNANDTGFLSLFKNLSIQNVLND